MRSRVSLLGAIAREAVAVPDRAAHALLLRDVDVWIRLAFLGAAARSGIADALAEPASLRRIAELAGVTDEELLEAFLELGVALGEVGRRGGRYRAKGRRLRATARRSEDLRGLVEELLAYDAPVYRALDAHLRGAPKGDYLDGVGDVIARSSRLAEPVLAPTVRSLVRALAPRSVLDVGCGSGVYLAHVLDAAPAAAVLGIDVDAAAIDVARAALASSGGCTLRHAALEDLSPDADGPFDLVLLLQNIYYWAPDDRPAVLSRLRALAPRGTVAVATATPNGAAVNRHFDLVLRVTQRNWRLPTGDELVADLRAAGFSDVDLLDPVPGLGLVVAVASDGGRDAQRRGASSM